ncbi:hypothetical protein CERSUDRAFT_87022 [Gelatoporia subvermispora B]|uniref:Peptidase A1 domain-containing protein n=1 Tax=Ceriporiopsis subvermispora (strain B) TaxID=914234 RepID=M2QNF3_CERS8|nr:hypothetical protein CERSUDRAFT_87022 [Gelatoporia subvermispora B]
MASPLVLSLLAFVSLALADPLRIPLARRTPRNASIERFADAADFVRLKYGLDAVQPKLQRRAGQTVGLPIINQDQDSSYIGTITVGTPGEQFNIVLDTGSSDLWLASSDCLACPRGTPEFNPSSSSSLQQVTGSTGQAQQLTIQYGSGSVAGMLVQDTVNMGGFTVNPQKFLLVEQMTSGLLDGDVSGIMGLAFQALATTQATPFWQALVNNNQFASPEMAFWLTRFLDDNNAQQNEPGGELTLGGTNSTLFTGDIEFQNLATVPDGPTFWMLEVSGVTVQGSSVSIPTGNSALAAIDTGTTLIGGPTNAVAAIFNAIPGSTALTGQMAGFFSFPCSTTLSISMAFGGQSWPISDADLNLGSVGNGQCLGGIFDLNAGSNVGSGNGNPDWVVGDTFLKNVYSVFRASPPSVGFAQLSDTAGGSSGAPSGTPGSATLSRTGAPLPTGSSGNPSSSGSSSNAAPPSLPSASLLAGLFLTLCTGLASSLAFFA